MKSEEQVRKIKQEQSENVRQIKDLKDKYANLEHIISQVDATNIDLNNKETFVKRNSNGSFNWRYMSSLW